MIANIDFGVFDLRLGYASGLLLAGVLLGRFRRIGRISTHVPVVAGIHLARRRLKMKPADSWGAVGGAMTSSAALVAIRRAADSNEPALSYTAAYAVASVLVTLAGRLVVRVMS